ncbi:MAG: DUF2279 domain-containing protein [Saprospiraceae bacterium]|nr:DUF2279 domain-containing protein [Saprospiraceae bacterium]
MKKCDFLFWLMIQLTQKAPPHYKGVLFFNDYGEWRGADKMGHALTAYNESKWAYESLRWAGVKDKKAIWLGMASGMLCQTAIEVLDGFSKDWGFSLPDMTANVSGCALFGIQQDVWKEQRLFLKISNSPKNYSKEPILVNGKLISVADVAGNLYGTSYSKTFFKDYNACIWWLSANPHSFSKTSKFPTWLNIAIGYSAENIFGGYKNVPPTNTQEYPRYSQYLLSFDIDLSRIKTKSKFLNTLFRTINFVKIPAPALEYNSLGKFKLHPILF